MIQKRKQRSSSKVNLVVSVVFHSALIAAIFFLAAREGMLGKKLKELTVTMVPKEKKPEPPKPEAPKPEPPKTVEAPKAVPPPKAEAASAPPLAGDLPPAVALPSFEFSDGAKQVESISDPAGIYKSLVEHSLRTHWNRPEDLADDNFVAEVEFTVDAKGRVTGTRWLSGSGNAQWDGSVKAAVAEVTTISRPPPKGFPEKFTVRFDVETSKTEPVQLSSR